MLSLVLYNAPTLPESDPDYASEAGVLESVAAVERACARAGIETERAPIGSELAPFARRLERRDYDAVVNFCEGFAGRSSGEGPVTGLLDLVEAGYTGSPSECLGLVRDKPRTKLLLRGAGIDVAEGFVVPVAGAIPDDVASWLERGPLVVKPAAEDASLGLSQASVVESAAELTRAVDEVQRRYGTALVETFLPGREFNAGVLALPAPRVLPVSEVAFRAGAGMKWNLLTYEAKWDAGGAADLATPVVCPAELDEALRARIEQIALRAFEAVGARDYARIDLRLDATGTPRVLEFNGNPDLGPEAGLARMIRAAGLDYDEVLVGLVRQAAARGRKPEVRTKVAANRASDGVTIRAYDGDRDLETLVAILVACGNFRPAEVEIGREVLVSARTDADYRVLVVEQGGVIQGWSCHGRVPLTESTWDLYWMAVDPAAQGSGIGGRLLALVEHEVLAAGGRRLIAETSSTASYDATRRFYERRGFVESGVIEDFYQPGDGRVVYVKTLAPASGDGCGEGSDGRSA